MTVSTATLSNGAGPAGFKIATKIFPLSEVEHVWEAAGSMPRSVFQMPDTNSPRRPEIFHATE